MSVIRHAPQDFAGLDPEAGYSVKLPALKSTPFNGAAS